MTDKTVTAVGYGISNASLVDYFIRNGIYPTVRCEKECSLPNGVSGIFGSEYLDTCEAYVFRSPVIRPDRIRGHGHVTTEASFALSLADALKIGVTGSDGKSTTSTLIFKMLERNYLSYLGGNIGIPLIDFCPYASLDSCIVAELSSFQLMDFGACLDVCVITNITENHLDWHTSMEEYINSKKNIMRRSLRAVLNYDDEIVRAFGRFCPVPLDKIHTNAGGNAENIFGNICKSKGCEEYALPKDRRKAHSDIRDRQNVRSGRNLLKNLCGGKGDISGKTPCVDFRPDITYFSLFDCTKLLDNAHFAHISDGYICYDREKIISADKLLLRGKFNLQNALAAVGAVYPLTDSENIVRVLSSFSGVSGRMELIKNLGGVSYFDSSIDSTPSRTAATLSAFDKPKTILIMGGYDKNLSYESLCDAVCGIKSIILCGANRNKIYDAVKNACPDIIFADNFDNAVLSAAARAVCGDSVLLSPASASFDMFKNYKERSARFKKAVSSIGQS